MPYAKGFKIDRKKIAETFNLADRNDPQVEVYFSAIVENLNRAAYKCVTTAYDHEALPGETPICNVVAFETGTNKEALEKLDLGPFDESIEMARSYVLVGPQVWELW